MESKCDVDVAIVGAGLAGLAAASSLLQAGRTVRVLEARERVGGRTQAGVLLAHHLDVGGQWVGPTQTSVISLCRRFGLDTYKQFDDGKRVLDINGRVRHYTGLIPRLNLIALFELDSTMRMVDRLASEIDPAAPWAHEKAAEYDDMTVAEWMRRRLRTRSARAAWDIAIRGTFSAEASELSFLHFLTYVRQGGSLSELLEITDGAQQFRVRGGAFQIAQELARHVGAERIQLGAAVSALVDDGTAVTVHHAKGTFSAARVIVAIPPPLIDRLSFSPQLSASRVALLQRMPMGAVIKVLLAYRRPFWRERGFSGEAFSDRLSLSPIYDACLPGVPEGFLVGFFEAKHAHLCSQLTQAQRQEKAVQTVTELFGQEGASPIAYAEHDWSAERWSRGGYAALLAPGAWTRFGSNLRTPHGHIHWAGTETATRWLGYMEGAIESGERAANEILHELSKSARLPQSELSQAI